MGDKVLLSMKHLNLTGERKLVHLFVGPFSIVQWAGPLAYQLNLGTCYIQVHPIFYISPLEPFCVGGYGCPHPTAVYVEDERVGSQ